MRPIKILAAGLIISTLWSCDNSIRDTWPPSPDGFQWPATKGDPLKFTTISNADLDDDVKKASEKLKSRYSTDAVTFCRSDLNADGRSEILIKTHHYGFAPSYAILSPDDSGNYSDIGWISGEHVFLCIEIDGWQSLQSRSGNDKTRNLYSLQNGIYDITRSEMLDTQSGVVTKLSPN